MAMLTVMSLRNHIQGIVPCRAMEKMLWVDATRRVTVMTNVVSNLDRTDHQFICEPMDKQMSLTKAERPVSMTGNGSCPKPAVILVSLLHLSPEAYFFRDLER